MATVELRIELPAYSHSFQVHVPTSSTIQEVKQEISRACPGQPRIDGQRLISKGRNLHDDERIEELWKAPSDSRILHLAVHPNSWTSQPPEIPQSPAQPSTTHSHFASAMPLSGSGIPAFNRFHLFQEPPFTARSPRPREHRPIPYISHLHQNAIVALTTGKPPSNPVASEDQVELRQAAITAIQGLGWAWPEVFDTNYPEESQQEGLKYNYVTVYGQQHLSLQNPNGTPTPVQLHALQVLSFTFTLLNIHVTSTSVFRTSTFATPQNVDLNQLLQQLGPNVPQLRVVNANNADGIVPQIRDLPLRPLLMPLAMLIFRTMLLLYFFAPARKPVFGVLILAWMLYEIWQPIRNNLLRRAQPPANNDLQPNVNQAQANPDLPNQPQPQGQQPPPGAVAPQQWEFRLSSIFTNLANLNLESEQQVLNRADEVAIVEPTIGQKAASFLSLFFSTLHPAVWNERRTALRRREGPIRTEAHIRQRPDEPETTEDGDNSRSGEQVDNNANQVRDELRAKHARRPEWIKRYIERVVAEDWVDDSD